MVTPTTSINRKIACSFSFIVNNYIKFVTLNLFFIGKKILKKTVFLLIWVVFCCI